ncbi:MULTISPECIES: hypothetical protein [unclassified Streptomyces]|uniref:hypothetical protein n=1 Tax=unclassified Streptomyces TaxID=2593676 RepID=UPI00136BFE36|nr:hypothetical protein [Streptomyces sp. SHP 1-2]MCW5249269.1 hypothetical protein [Streptomyces sp. SHP 1-2]MYU21515.1 hypothetical protein [Streptomyces sp. SID8352]
MAEYESEREDREDRESGERRDEAARGQGVPFDEDAAWQSIVAGYGQEPPDPPGAKPFKSVEDLALLEAEPNDGKPDPEPEASPAARPLGSSIAFAPGVGPRDHSLAEASEDDFDEDDEGHFVPPEPPPMAGGDATDRFAWLGVLGGPVLLLLAVLLSWDMTWWLTTLSIGGFLGGVATLVTRMRTDEDDEDPGRGAVV